MLSISWFIISYDLNKKGQDYKSLIPMLKNVLKAYPILESVWILPTSDLSSQQIHDMLKGPGLPLDENDGLIVATIDNVVGSTTLTPISEIPIIEIS